eukprot:442557_1
MKKNQNHILSLSFQLPLFLQVFYVQFYVKWSNGKKTAVVDNAKWIAPLIFTLQIYDFISDINLSYDILTNPLASSKSVILYCGVLSVLCTLIPFLSNLWYGV